MQRMFRKVNRKFSSDEVRIERELTKSAVEVGQYGMLAVALYTFSQGRVLPAAIVLGLALHFEKMIASVYEAVSDTGHAQYIRDHYTSMTNLSDIFASLGQRVAKGIHEDVDQLVTRASHLKR